MSSVPRDSDVPRDWAGRSGISRVERMGRAPGFSRLDFLEALFGSYFESHKGFIMVRSAAHLEKKASTRHFPKIDALAKETFPRNQQVWFGVCPRENVRPGPESIAYCTSLWTVLDIASESKATKGSHFTDAKKAARAVRYFPLRPSIIVESGLGLDLYWLLKKPVKVERPAQLEDILDRIQKYFSGSEPVKMGGMLRLPDTAGFNELGEVMLCKVKFLNTDFSYVMQEILDSLALVDRFRREMESEQAADEEE